MCFHCCHEWAGDHVDNLIIKTRLCYYRWDNLATRAQCDASLSRSNIAACDVMDVDTGLLYEGKNGFTQMTGTKEHNDKLRLIIETHKPQRGRLLNTQIDI